MGGTFRSQQTANRKASGQNKRLGGPALDVGSRGNGQLSWLIRSQKSQRFNQHAQGKEFRSCSSPCLAEIYPALADVIEITDVHATLSSVGSNPPDRGPHLPSDLVNSDSRVFVHFFYQRTGSESKAPAPWASS